MRIIVVHILLVHVHDRSQHFGAAKGERRLAIDTSQIHGSILSGKLEYIDSTLNLPTLPIGFLGYCNFLPFQWLTRAEDFFVGDKFTRHVHSGSLIEAGCPCEAGSINAKPDGGFAALIELAKGILQ